MGTQISMLLSDSNRTVGQSLEKMTSDVSTKLQNMSRTASDLLTQSTSSALVGEKKKIKDGWIKFLEQNARSMATLLARVAPSAILNNDYITLISYIKSAGSNENVVYAMYYTSFRYKRHINVSVIFHMYHPIKCLSYHIRPRK